MLSKLQSKQEDRTIQQLLYNETRNVVRPRELLNTLISKEDSDLYCSESLQKRGVSSKQVSNQHFATQLEEREPSSKELFSSQEPNKSEEHYSNEFKNRYRRNLKMAIGKQYSGFLALRSSIQQGERRASQQLPSNMASNRGSLGTPDTKTKYPPRYGPKPTM